MKIFLDVGAHIGQTLEVVIDRKYAFDKIVCFEPVAENIEKLRTFPDERIIICDYGLWNETCLRQIYNPKSMGASLFSDKFKENVKSQKIKLVQASKWFEKNLRLEDRIFLKLNCEGAEVTILKDLISSGEYKKIDVLMVDFDVRKIPSQKHFMNEMKATLKTLDIPKMFFADEIYSGETHNQFTRKWLDKCND